MPLGSIEPAAIVPTELPPEPGMLAPIAVVLAETAAPLKLFVNVCKPNGDVLTFRTGIPPPPLMAEPPDPWLFPGAPPPAPANAIPAPKVVSPPGVPSVAPLPTSAAPPAPPVPIDTATPTPGVTATKASLQI